MAGKNYDGCFGRQLQRGNRFDNLFQWLAGRIDQNDVRFRARPMPAERFQIRSAADDFDFARPQQSLQARARKRGSGDDENADHAATELLGEFAAPSCTVTQRTWE